MRTITVENPDFVGPTEATVLTEATCATPAISIVMPIYGISERLLRRSIDSIMSQDFTLGLELICVDDGSDDDGATLKILDEYAKKYNNITVVTQKNMHAGIARNAGIAVARGEWIHFFDPDDWVKQGVYTAIWKIVKKAGDVDFIKFATPNRRYGSANLDKLFVTDHDKVFAINNLYFELWNGVYKKTFLDNNRIRGDGFRCNNDVIFHFHSLIFARRLYISTCVVQYIYKPGISTSAVARARHFNDELQIYWIIRGLAPLNTEIWYSIKHKIINGILFWADYIFNDCITPEEYKAETKRVVAQFLHKIPNWDARTADRKQVLRFRALVDNVCSIEDGE